MLVPGVVVFRIKRGARDAKTVHSALPFRQLLAPVSLSAVSQSCLAA
jgi:hypothetical protein